MSDNKSPSRAEDEFFAREEIEKLHRLHKEKSAAEDEQARAERKAQHWMKCPKCGADLTTVRWRTVDVDKCFSCGVIVLDDGELEKLAGEEHNDSFLGSFVKMFRAT